MKWQPWEAAELVLRSQLTFAQTRKKPSLLRGEWYQSSSYLLVSFSGWPLFEELQFPTVLLETIRKSLILQIHFHRCMKAGKIFISSSWVLQLSSLCLPPTCPSCPPQYNTLVWVLLVSHHLTVSAWAVLEGKKPWCSLSPSPVLGAFIFWHSLNIKVRLFHRRVCLLCNFLY